MQVSSFTQPLIGENVEDKNVLHKLHMSVSAGNEEITSLEIQVLANLGVLSPYKQTPYVWK